MTPQLKKGVSAALSPLLRIKKPPIRSDTAKRFETTVPDLDSLLLLTACIHF